MLAIWLVFEHLAFLFIRSAKPRLNNKFRTILIVLWWVPVFSMVLFLSLASVVPLQLWNPYLRIYLPGLVVATLLAKTIMFVFLIPPILMEAIRLGFMRRRKVGGFYIYLMKFLKRMGILIGSLAFVGLFIGSIHWVSRFKTREVTLTIEHLPEALRGLKIVQLSDIHLGSWASVKPIEKAVEIVNSLEPDIVVFTGDMVNFSGTETKGFEEALKEIKAPLGVYAILGNHDYGDYVPWTDSLAKAEDFKILETFYNTIGWKLLRNEHTVLNIDNSSLLIAGTENWSATPRFHRYGDMKRTMQGAPDTDVSILLSHDPTHWEAEVIKEYPRFHITLSGHTHGMQMGFEGFGVKWSPSQYMYKQWGGLYEKQLPGKGISRLYVNLGLGHIAYPGRVGILPEITLITLEN